MNCNQCRYSAPNITNDSHHISCTCEISTLGDGVPVLNLHGFKNGWADYPINFDPIWIESCGGFLTKEDTENLNQTTLAQQMALAFIYKYIYNIKLKDTQQ